MSEPIFTTPIKRFHRYRKTEVIRDSLAEVKILEEDLILPMFIRHGSNEIKEIPQMPGFYQITTDQVIDYLADLVELGLRQVILFGIPSIKDELGSGALDPRGPVPQTISLLKDQFGSRLEIYADVCLCEYTSHGHCGIIDPNGLINNDSSLPLHAEAAVTYAESGADWVAPSSMLDGRVNAIRRALDDRGFRNVGILSYSAKFASNYYGPFRQAAESSPSFGDRKTYQIDFRSRRQPLMELMEDERQGADALMVKPALAYLDIIAHARQITNLPIYAYNVSGEYAFVKFGAKQGIFNEPDVVMENLTAIKRAGADLILTYHAEDILKKGWLK
ncbi:MAG: porphobilinogen synthase [Methanobacteriota archaeon]|nr:MAG: porphobilinogen synthase [Euryarchaeota archaeon]